MMTNVEPTLLEYRLKPVTRVMVIRHARYPHPATGEEVHDTRCKGEYETGEVAYEVGRALCKTEREELGWSVGDDRIRYPDLGTILQVAVPA